MGTKQFLQWGCSYLEEESYCNIKMPSSNGDHHYFIRVSNVCSHTNPAMLENTAFIVLGGGTLSHRLYSSYVECNKIGKPWNFFNPPMAIFPPPSLPPTTSKKWLQILCLKKGNTGARLEFEMLNLAHTFQRQCTIVAYPIGETKESINIYSKSTSQTWKTMESNHFLHILRKKKDLHF